MNHFTMSSGVACMNELNWSWKSLWTEVETVAWTPALVVQ